MKTTVKKSISILLTIVSLFTFCFSVMPTPVAALSNNVHDILFSWEYYYAANPDVAKAFGKNPSSLRSHYDRYGKAEGRAPSELFDPKVYLGLYSDLKAAFGNNYTAAYNHFVSNGINEGRQASSKFSVSVYKANYSDLRAAFGNNNLLYLKHYREYGIKEGRNAISKIATSSSTSNNRNNININASVSPIIKTGYYVIRKGDYAWNVQYAPKTGIGNFVLDGISNGNYEPNEVFYIEYISSKKAYYITPVYRQGEAAANALYGKSCTPGSQMKLHPSNTSDTASLWYITAGNDGFRFQNVASGLYVTMQSSARTGTKLLLKHQQSTLQGFSITEVSSSKVAELKSEYPNGLLYPLKGAVTRTSQSAKTNGYYCDFKAAKGTPVYAPADGTVNYKQTICKGQLVSYGNWVDFTSSDGVYRVKMGHLSSFVGVSSSVTSKPTWRISASKVEGEYSTVVLSKKVKKGELIGYSGETGNAHGAHIHLEVYKNNKAIDPLKNLAAW